MRNREIVATVFGRFAPGDQTPSTFMQIVNEYLGQHLWPWSQPVFDEKSVRLLLIRAPGSGSALKGLDAAAAISGGASR